MIAQDFNKRYKKLLENHTSVMHTFEAVMTLLDGLDFNGYAWDNPTYDSRLCLSIPWDKELVDNILYILQNGGYTIERDEYVADQAKRYIDMSTSDSSLTIVVNPHDVGAKCTIKKSGRMYTPKYEVECA